MSKTSDVSELVSGLVFLLQNQNGLHYLVCSKTSLLTLGCGEGKCSMFCRIVGTR